MLKTAPEVDVPDNRATKVIRSADGLFYKFEVYCVRGDELFNLMAGIPMTQASDHGFYAQFTLPAQIVAEMFAGVAEAAMTPADSEEAAERIATVAAQ